MKLSSKQEGWLVNLVAVLVVVMATLAFVGLSFAVASGIYYMAWNQLAAPVLQLDQLEYPQAMEHMVGIFFGVWFARIIWKGITR